MRCYPADDARDDGRVDHARHVGAALAFGKRFELGVAVVCLARVSILPKTWFPGAQVCAIPMEDRIWVYWRSRAGRSLLGLLGATKSVKSARGPPPYQRTILSRNAAFSRTAKGRRWPPSL